MNFSMRNFIKNGFLKAIGKTGDYWIILNAAGWCDKGILLLEDLVEIQAAIDAQNAAFTESPDDNGDAIPTESPDDNADEPMENPETTP